MSDFEHRNDKRKTLKKPFGTVDLDSMEGLGKLSAHVGPEGLTKILSGSFVQARDIPRQQPHSEYNAEWWGNYDGPNDCLLARLHPAKVRAIRKTQELRSARQANAHNRQRGMPGIRRSWKLPRKSLRWLADELGKSVRQVRRYCELGLVPGSYQTTGGHWRARSGIGTVAAVQKNIREFGRKAWTHGERRSLRRQNQAGTSLSRADVAIALNAVAEIEPPKAMQAVDERERSTRLAVAAKNIFNSKRRLSAKSIAGEMQISRASLYRFFSADEIKAVIRSAREAASDPGSVIRSVTQPENPDEEPAPTVWSMTAETL